MKVIKAGRAQHGWAKEFTCTGRGNGDGGCRAVLLVEESDLFRTESYARNETDTFITFECVQCRSWTDLTSAQASCVPDAVRSSPVRVPGRRYDTYRGTDL